MSASGLLCGIGGESSCDAEVEDFEEVVSVILEGDEEIGGLDIAVEDALLVDSLDALAGLSHEVEDARPWEGALELKQGEEVDALEGFHDEVEVVIGFAKIEDTDDVGGLDLEGEVGFAAEFFDGALPMGSVAGHSFDDARLGEEAIPREEDLAHAALVEAFLEVITPKAVGLVELVLEVLVEP